MNPYTETQLDDHTVLRVFSEETPEEEFIWHQDKEDRVIEATHPTDWKFQFDNKLPQSIMEKIKIPKDTFHRIIKGNENCEIRITKI